MIIGFHVFKYNKTKIHNSTKVFQALRILVNKEISELIFGLINAAKVLKKETHDKKYQINFHPMKLIIHNQSFFFH